MEEYVNKKILKTFMQFIERFIPMDKQPPKGSENPAPESSNHRIEDLIPIISPNASISEGVLVQNIPKREYKIGFQSAKISKGVFTNLVSCSMYAEAINLLKSDSDLIESVFFDACQANNPTLCRLLLDKKKFMEFAVNPNTKTSYGRSALHLAALEGFISICEVLLDYGENIDLNIQDIELKTPLHIACIYNEVKIVQLLVRSGAEINPVDNQGNTPLHYAYMNSNEVLIDWLITKNADLSITNLEGNTPSQAVQKKNLLKITNDVEDDSYKVNTPNAINYSMMIEEINNFFIKPFCSLRLTPHDFRPLALLGRGNFGEVYLVEKNNTKEQFAMKILAKNKVIAEHLVSYAMVERNVMSSIKHPFIVSLRYSFQTESKLYLIEDYCAGGTLRKYLSQDNKFNESLSKVYMCEVILALEELHRNDIIYRDLKPENVGIDNRGHVHLIDFGLSKDNVFEKNAAYSFCGTISYLAPEMLSRTGHGKAVDWYLLGVLLYEMLTGTVPFFSMNNQKMFQNILYSPIKIPKGISESCSNLLLGLMEKDPDLRMGSKNDAADVKSHQFFSGIDWESVLLGQLNPPLPQITKPSEEGLPMSTILDSSSDVQPNIQGWTFVCSTD